MTTAVITAVLCWFGWLLLLQQREIDERRASAQLESTADAMAAAIRGRLADAGDRLSAWLSDPSAPPPAIGNAVILAIDGTATRLTPAGGLPFVPVVPEDDVARHFDAVEILEYRNGARAIAAARYLALAAHADPRVCAGALFRLGRVSRGAGDYTRALSAYERLSDLTDVRVGNLPADLAGLLGKREVLVALGKQDEAAAVDRSVQHGLDEGRWRVARGEAVLYRERASHLPLPDSWRLADAVSEAWRAPAGRLPGRGHRTFSDHGRAVLLVWRSSGARTALLAAFVDSFLVPPPGAAANVWRLSDAEGRPLTGVGPASAVAVARVLDAEYPWKLEVWSSRTAGPDAGSSRAVLLMLAVTLVFVWGTAYLMGRAIRREAAVARLQSDFVAAVSHEFRSPLTTVRQLAEMLESGRLTTEGRRREYYRVLASEAGRLQRLVETLLNFGRMEAGAAQYQFEAVEASALVRSVVRDVESQAREAGLRVEMSGPDTGVLLRGDEHALGVALRNLADNAIKYSPGQQAVRIEWEQAGARVVIRVIDTGFGIPTAEQQEVFRKFVRGQAAGATNVRGTGVGLSMVRQIVLAHGGQVHLDSTVGRGSTFTVLLPAAGPSRINERATA
jgi:signal transduction histidine kinase